MSTEEIKNEDKKQNQPLTEVWGDTVNLKELTISIVLGVVLTMAFFLVGRQFFYGIDSIDENLAKGYALFVGIVGCFLAAFISAKKFKPKRFIGELNDIGDIEDVLEYAHMTVSEEADALAKVDKSVIKEMEDLELYSLLALIPEDSPNYKAEYKKLAEAKSSKEGVRP